MDAPATAVDSPKPAKAAGPGLHLSGSVVAGIFGVLFLAIGLGVAAYLKLTPHPLSIGSVLKDLRTFDGTSVTVQGEVKETYNVGGMKWYDLSDPTGSIRVVTERGLPTTGDYMRVTGIVHQVFNVGGFEYTVLLEPPAPSS
jgi:hypothetical protein